MNRWANGWWIPAVWVGVMLRCSISVEIKCAFSHRIIVLPRPAHRQWPAERQQCQRWGWISWWWWVWRSPAVRTARKIAHWMAKGNRWFRCPAKNFVKWIKNMKMNALFQSDSEFARMEWCRRSSLAHEKWHAARANADSDWQIPHQRAKKPFRRTVVRLNVRHAKKIN